MGEYSDTRYSDTELHLFIKEVRRNDAVDTVERVDNGDIVTGAYGASAIIEVTAAAAEDGWEDHQYDEILPEEYEWERHEQNEEPASGNCFTHAILMPLALSE